MSVNNSDIKLTAAIRSRSSDCGSNDFTVQTGSAQTTEVDLSNGSINEEDIDPFTYHPSFTKWDYLKVWPYCN